MPYFVFRISPDKQLTLLNSHDRFKDAMKQCRDMRRELVAGDATRIRMAFGNTEYEAKRLLTERRQQASPLEEWEG